MAPTTSPRAGLRSASKPRKSLRTPKRPKLFSSTEESPSRRSSTRKPKTSAASDAVTLNLEASDVMDMTCVQLKDNLRLVGEPVSGRKAELQERLIGSIGASARKQKQTSTRKKLISAVVDEDSDDDSGIESTVRRLDVELDDVEDAQWEGKPLSAFKVVQLKDILRDNGLSVVGRKAELIERLGEFIMSQGGEDGDEVDGDEAEVDGQEAGADAEADGPNADAEADEQNADAEVDGENADNQDPEADEQITDQGDDYDLAHHDDQVDEDAEQHAQQDKIDRDAQDADVQLDVQEAHQHAHDGGQPTEEAVPEHDDKRSPNVKSLRVGTPSSQKSRHSTKKSRRLSMKTGPKGAPLGIRRDQASPKSERKAPKSASKSRAKKVRSTQKTGPRGLVRILDDDTMKIEVPTSTVLTRSRSPRRSHREHIPVQTFSPSNEDEAQRHRPASPTKRPTSPTRRARKSPRPSSPRRSSKPSSPRRSSARKTKPTRPSSPRRTSSQKKTRPRKSREASPSPIVQAVTSQIRMSATKRKRGASTPSPRQAAPKTSSSPVTTLLSGGSPFSGAASATKRTKVDHSPSKHATPVALGYLAKTKGSFKSPHEDATLFDDPPVQSNLGATVEEAQVDNAMEDDEEPSVVVEDAPIVEEQGAPIIEAKDAPSVGVEDAPVVEEETTPDSKQEEMENSAAVNQPIAMEEEPAVIEVEQAPTVDDMDEVSDSPPSQTANTDAMETVSTTAPGASATLKKRPRAATPEAWSLARIIDAIAAQPDIRRTHVEQILKLLQSHVRASDAHLLRTSIPAPSDVVEIDADEDAQSTTEVVVPTAIKVTPFKPMSRTPFVDSIRKETSVTNLPTPPRFSVTSAVRTNKRMKFHTPSVAKTDKPLFAKTPDSVAKRILATISKTDDDAAEGFDKRNAHFTKVLDKYNNVGGQTPVVAKVKQMEPVKQTFVFSPTVVDPKANGTPKPSEQDLAEVSKKFVFSS